MKADIEPHIVESLLREWSGLASEQDRKLLAEWYTQNENDHRVSADQLKSIWNVSGRVNTKAPLPVPEIRERVWATVYSSAGRAESAQKNLNHATKTRRKHSFSPAVWLASASATIALFAVVFLSDIGINPLSRGADVSEAPHTYHTKAGQRARVTLPDGSIVTLNSASTISYSRAFGDDNREVNLSGEAVFSVVQSTAAPFIVNAGASTTRVLGTVFGVRYYPGDQAARVIVTEGKVGFGHRAVQYNGGPGNLGSNYEILSVGDVASLTTDNSLKVQRNADISMLAWTSGKLELSRMPLHEAIDELSRWFDIKIKVSNPELLKRRITTVITDETAKQAMKLVSLALGADTSWSGNVVTFLQEDPK